MKQLGLGKLVLFGCRYGLTPMLHLTYAWLCVNKLLGTA